MYLRQKWVDSRMKYSQGEPWDSNNLFTGNHEILNKIWVPDTFNPNDRTTGGGGKHELTVPNVFVRISPDGTIFYSQRITTRAKCNEDRGRSKYPFDHRECNVTFESYGFSNEDIKYKWKVNPDKTKPEVGISSPLPDFTTPTVETWTSDLYLPVIKKSYNVIGLKMKMRRFRCGLWSRNIIPSIVVCLLSFVPLFLFEKSSKNNRTLLLLSVACFLAQLMLTNQRKPSGLQEVVTSLDRFNMWSLVVTALGVLYVAVSTNCQKNDQKERGCESVDKGKMLNGGNVESGPDTNQNDTKKSRKDQAKKLLSRFGKFLVPLIYVVFHLVFWVL